MRTRYCIFSYDLPQLSFFILFNQDYCNNKWLLDFKLDTNNLFKSIVYSFFLQNQLEKDCLILSISYYVSEDFKEKDVMTE